MAAPPRITGTGANMANQDAMHRCGPRPFVQEIPFSLSSAAPTERAHEGERRTIPLGPSTGRSFTARKGGRPGKRLWHRGQILRLPVESPARRDDASRAGHVVSREADPFGRHGRVSVIMQQGAGRERTHTEHVEDTSSRERSRLGNAVSVCACAAAVSKLDTVRPALEREDIDLWAGFSWPLAGNWAGSQVARAFDSRDKSQVRSKDRSQRGRSARIGEFVSPSPPSPETSAASLNRLGIVPTTFVHGLQRGLTVDYPPSNASRAWCGG